jgi:YidC/Oxa1 family membrane protein insertase
VSENNRNLFLAIGLSLLVLIVWERFLMPKALPPQPVAVTGGQAGQATGTAGIAAVPVVKTVTDSQALAAAPRVKILTPTLSGSLNLRGAQFDDLVLTQYKETLDKKSPAIHLLHPAGTKQVYLASFGWIGQNAKVPNDQTVWQSSARQLTPAAPVTLTWNNGAGLQFEIVIAVDRKYLFTITQRVLNTSASTVTLNPYGSIYRARPVQASISSANHEGSVGVFESLKEETYGSMTDAEDRRKEYTASAAWLGFTDKYWLTAIIPDPKLVVTGRVENLGGPDEDHENFKTDVILKPVAIAAGQSSKNVTHFFAGAKEVATIDAYNKKLGAKSFDKAIDWGWFWYFTKPFFWILHQLYGVFGNFGLAIIGLTVIVKILFFPIASKQYESFARMKHIQPKVKELQARNKDDKLKMQQEMMALYKSEKVNPLGGCLPIFLQIPVFFAVYKVIFVALEMRHQPFFGWIKDLSAADPLTPFNLFGLLPFTPPNFGLISLAVGILPLILGVTMWVQQKMQPMQGMDPSQQAIMKFMPIIFTFMMAPFAAGVVVYWITNNTLSIAQQWYITRRLEKKYGDAPVPAK